jgi:hypothetical protein
MIYEHGNTTCGCPCRHREDCEACGFYTPEARGTRKRNCTPPRCASAASPRSAGKSPRKASLWIAIASRRRAGRTSV